MRPGIKIVLDTNVLISALLSSGYPSDILFLILERKILLCLSSEVLEEYKDVVNRDKFAKIKNFQLNATLVLNRLESCANYFSPKRKVEILRDLTDNKFLELALSSGADFLVTGNSNDFTITEFGVTKVLNPKEFVDYINSPF